MPDVTESGKESIQSNDGKMKIGLTGNDIDLTVPIEGEDRFKLSNEEFKVSQEGISVDDATNEESIVNKDDNVFKIAMSGVVSLPAFTTADGAREIRSVTVNHNLGVIPAVIAYKQGTSGQYLGQWEGFKLNSYSFGTGAKLGITAVEWQDITITTSSVTFTKTVVLSQNGGSFSTPIYNIKYFILRETAN